MKIRIIISLLFISQFYRFIYAQNFEEITKVTANVREEQDQFGYETDISGSYAIVGAPYEDEDENDANYLEDAGAAYIFKRDNNGNWNFHQKITPLTRIENSNFGCSVSMDGKRAIIGAFNADVDISGTNIIKAGYAYVFCMDSLGVWTEEQRLYASDHDASDYFGCSAALSADYAIVGAHWEDEDETGGNFILNAGSAYIFEKDAGDTWTEKQKLVAWDRKYSESFGISVDISGETAIAGAPSNYQNEFGGDSVKNAGAAFLFKRNASGDWIPLKKAVAPVRSFYDFFGSNVSISDHVAVIGVPDEDEDEEEHNTLFDAGSAYIFESNGSGTWDFTQKIAASDRESMDFFGMSVDVSGNRIVVGSSNESEDAEGNNTLNRSGSVYIFKKNGSGIWNEVQKIVASDRNAEDRFGNVALDGSYLIVGANYEDNNVSGDDFIEQAGSAYFFESCPSGDQIPQANIIENGDFGYCNLESWNLLCPVHLGVIADYQFYDGACLIKPLKLNSSPEMWHIQLEQPFSSQQIDMLEEGEQYILTFDAYAESDNMPCHVFFGQNEEPYATLLDADILLNNETEAHSFEFTMSSVYSSMKLAIEIGTETTWAAFDNIRLVNKSALGIGDAAITENFRIVPNPATSFLHVYAENGSIVKLYTISGIPVLEATVVSGKSVNMNVSELKNGIYIIKIIKDTGISAGKLLIKH